MKRLSYRGLFISIKLFIPESPHLTGFSKAHKCSNKTVNRSNDPLTRRAHAELGKNYEILLLATLTSVLTQKLMPDCAGVILGQTPHCTEQNASQMPRIWGWTVLGLTGILTTLNVTTLPFSIPQLNRCQIGHLYKARFFLFTRIRPEVFP